MFVPTIVYMLRVSNSDGVPLIEPVALSNTSPAGKSGVIAHETITPSPVTVGSSGRTLLTVLLAKFRSSGE